MLGDALVLCSFLYIHERYISRVGFIKKEIVSEQIGSYWAENSFAHIEMCAVESRVKMLVISVNL